MVTWVALKALDVELGVLLEGVGDADARAFVQSWEWCGARFVDAAPAGAVLVGGTVTGGAGEGSAGAGVEGDPGEGIAAERKVRASTYRALADHLSGLITRVAIDERRAELLMFHAGGVADPATGNVIAFMGPSGRGKTTASIALGQVYEYVTDETLAVTDALEVLPYGKPLSVKQPPPEPFKDQVSPTALGLNRPGGRGAAAPRLRLVGVVLLDRQAEYAVGQRPSIRSVGVAESIEELVGQISYLPERPHPLQRLVAVLDACGGLQAVTYGEAATLPQLFGELFAAAGAATVVSARAAGVARVAELGSAGLGAAVGVGALNPGSAAGPSGEANGLGEAGASPAREAGADARHDAHGEELQAAYTDAVRDGDSLVVLNGATVRVLSGIAPAIVEATARPTTFDEVVAAVVTAHGDPGDGRAAPLVRAAVDELVGIGLLTVATPERAHAE